MHVMMGGRIMPFKQAVTGKAFWENLKSKVADYIQ
jgi:hypothetical protein